MNMVLARNWWALALRGLFAILFGLGAFALPGITLAVLVGLFGAYVLLDGGFAIVGSVRAAERHERWWPMLLEGLTGAVAGVLTFVWPAVTAVMLLYLIGFWASISGILKIVVAVRLRRAIRGEWAHALNGVISVLFGVFLIAIPGVGILAVVWWIAGYAFFRGIMLLALAFRLRHHYRKQRGPESAKAA